MEKSGPPPTYSMQPQPPGFIIQQNPIPTFVNQMPIQLGPESQNMTCPLCNQLILTQVKVKPSLKTHLIAMALCVFGCCCCACVPYFVDTCQSKYHYCPQCQSYLGAYIG